MIGINMHSGAKYFPKISVITPCLNQAQFIEQTIHSVLSQDYPNLEYIVIDGGSMDGTTGVLKKYSSKLAWISQKDEGQADAINKGLKLASGEIIGFLNADDLYMPMALQCVGECFENHSETSWLIGRCRIIDSTGKEIRKSISIYKNFWLQARVPYSIFVLNFISQPATFWRRSLIERVGFLNQHLNYALDYEYWLRLYLHYPPFVIKDVLACFRWHSGSKSGSTCRAQFDEQYQVARQYTHSPLLLALHRAHNWLAIQTYQHLQASARPVRGLVFGKAK
jgi:glycosyltransferase involved in cell wall biosynthesis